MNKNCFIIVDCQYDFMPGGSLAVKGGKQIIPFINDLLPKFDLIIFTKDFHPAKHKSFASSHEGKNIFDVINLNGIDQVLWPDHCIQGNRGSDIHENINFSLCKNFYIFKKGMDLEVDSYSGFYDNNKKNSTGLSEFLHKQGVKEISICGLALDYCVYYTILDALEEGFKVKLILNATKPINKKNIPKLLKELKSKGVLIQ